MSTFGPWTNLLQRLGHQTCPPPATFTTTLYSVEFGSLQFTRIIQRNAIFNLRKKLIWILELEQNTTFAREDICILRCAMLEIKSFFQRRESNLQAVKRIIFTVLYYLKGGNNI